MKMSGLLVLTFLLLHTAASGTQQFLFKRSAVDETQGTLNSTDIGLRMTEVTLLSCGRLCATFSWCSVWLHESSLQECVLVRHGPSAGMGLATQVVLQGFQSWVDLCPASDGFQRIPSSGWCFRVDYDTSASYTQAKELCKAGNSELISLDSQEKLQVLQTMLISQNVGTSKNMRVGGYREAYGGLFDFVLENGRPFPFNEGSDAWVSGQPNNVYGKQNCLALTSDGRFELHDEVCEENGSIAGYVCEKLQA